MDASAFIEFIDELHQTLAARPDVIGLVLLGSAADRARRDEWSDHDFFVITVDDAQEAMRTDLRWLPAHDTIALSPRETEHGLKVVYDSGHVLEFAVFSLAELQLAGANAYEVVLDRGGVAEAMAGLAARERPPRNDEANLGLFVALLLIGVGRARRGELLVAGNLVRTYAVERLLRALPRDDARLDDLDPFRRVELVYPSLGLAEALEQPVEDAARTLLEIAERELGPIAGAEVLRRRLGWGRE